MDAENGIFRHLTDDGLIGDGTNYDCNVDGSVTAVPFYIQAPADEDYYITRLMWYFSDTNNWSANNFADFAAPLTNGLMFAVQEADDTVTLDFTDVEPIKSNKQFHAMFYDADPVSYGAGDDSLVGRWTFTKDFGGEPLKLKGGDGTVGQKLVLTVQDNLTLATAFHVKVRGFKASRPLSYNNEVVAV